MRIQYNMIIAVALFMAQVSSADIGSRVCRSDAPEAFIKIMEFHLPHEDMKFLEIRDTVFIKSSTNASGFPVETYQIVFGYKSGEVLEDMNAEITMGFLPENPRCKVTKYEAQYD